MTGEAGTLRLYLPWEVLFPDRPYKELDSMGRAVALEIKGQGMNGKPIIVNGIEIGKVTDYRVPVDNHQIGIEIEWDPNVTQVIVYRPRTELHT